MNQEPNFRPDGYWGMRREYTRKEQERVDSVRRNYELAMEAGDTKATNHWQEQLIKSKERLLASQSEFDIKTANHFWPGDDFPSQKQQQGLRELRIAMAESGEAGGPTPKPSVKPVITGSGFRKPKGGGDPVKVSDAILKANAEAAKAKVAADKAALGATDKPKLAADGLDLIRQAKEKRFGRVEPSNVPPKSNTANIIPRQEAIDEARALEEAAKEKAFADRQAYEERQLERAASKKLLEERRADAAKLKESKRAAAAEKKAMIAAGEPLDPNMSSKPTKTIPPATAAQVLGGTEGPTLAQPILDIPDVEADIPGDTPEDRAARMKELAAEENRAAYERIANEKATLAAENEAKKLLKAEEIAKKQASMIDYNGKPTHPSNLSALELDRLIEERSALKGKDFGVRFDTRKLKEDNPKHMAWKKHVQELLALETEQKSRADRAATQTEVNAAKPPKISDRQSEQQRIIQAAKDEAARRNAPAPRLAPAEQLGTPPPAPTATPVVATDPAVAERAARRAAALAELAALDAAEAPRLATPTVTVTTPEGLKTPAAPAGYTPEQLASLAEADAWEAARKAKPEKGRTAPVAPPTENPARQTPSAGTGRGGALGGGSGPGSGGIPPSAAHGFGGLVFGMSMKDLNDSMAESGEDSVGRTASQRDPSLNNPRQSELATKYMEAKVLRESLRPPNRKQHLEPINWDGAMLFRKMQGGD